MQNCIRFYYLQTDPKQIQELKNSECYSPIYEIVINLTDSNQLYSPRLAGMYFCFFIHCCKHSNENAIF